MQTSMEASSEKPKFKVGDVFTSKIIKDLPEGESCPFYQLSELKGIINCGDYFGDDEIVFQITSIDNHIDFGIVYYLKETSGTKSGIRIPHVVLEYFVENEMWKKVDTDSADTASADTASAHNLYTNPDYNTIFYKAGTRKSKKRKTKKRKIIKRRKTRRR
jgi:hypothetical protein